MAPRAVRTDTTATAVATRAEGGVPQGKSIAQFLSDPGMKRELQRAAAAAFDVDHLMRITLTQIRKNPTLGMCTQTSLAGAMMMSAELGLDPGILGLVYYVPFNNKVKLPGGGERWEKQVQFIIGYKGLLELVRRSNQVATVFANVVYEGDDFSITYGSEQRLIHIPTLKAADRGALVGAYAYAKMKSGEEQWVFMNKDEVESVRKRSKAANDGPWVSDWEEMAKKTALKRLCKVLPLSIKDQRLIVADSAVVNATKADDLIDLDDLDYAEVEVAPTIHPVDTSKVDVETGEFVEESTTEPAEPTGIKTPMVGEE